MTELVVIRVLYINKHKTEFHASSNRLNKLKIGSQRKLDPVLLIFISFACSLYIGVILMDMMFSMRMRNAHVRSSNLTSYQPCRHGKFHISTITTTTIK